MTNETPDQAASETSATGDTSDERLQVIQAVAERVESYQESAEEGVIEKELRSALAETDVQVSDDEVTRLVQAIEQGEGNVDVRQVLGA